MPEIKTDTLTRRLYATDASLYQEMPEGVSFPKSPEDIREVVLRSAEEGFTITARSAGTSLAGQTTGGGVIMDVSRYMTEITELNPDKRYARVQPGVIRDTLNREAAKFGLQFGPDTATTNRCMLGGMIGNNSCGAFSIKHKTTREHVLEIDAVLSDGSTTVFRALTPNELDAKLKLNNLEGNIYRGIIKLLKENKEKIRKHYPHPDIIRRNTGYPLDVLCEMDPITPGGRPFNLAELLCGSEGTLAMTASAKVNLVPLPKHKAIVIPQFRTINDAMVATVEAVKLEPSAVELIDDVILSATEINIEQKKNRFFLDGKPKCILIIQFEGDDHEVQIEKAKKLAKILEESNLSYAQPVFYDDYNMGRVWELRKAGLGLLMGLHKEYPSPTFVEDAAVRVEDLPAYIRDFQQILKKYDTKCVYYAHASVGTIHTRPVIDVTRPEGIETLKNITREAADLIKKYRGAFSGEHGDGRVRAPFLETVLDKEILPILKEVKALWDPDFRFNPGKIVDPKPLDTDLRYSTTYKQPNVETTFNWRQSGSFGAAIEQCNGAGVCRKLPGSGGTMCPSYHATREEKDNTRGRANLFRQLFSTQQADAFTSEEIKEALDLCLSCKACKSECPANVDMAKMKAEFMHGWHERKGITFGEKFFGRPEKFYPLASALPSVTNFVNSLTPVKWIVEKSIGVDRRRDLPKFAKQTFEKWYKKNHTASDRPEKKQVLLLVDIFTNYHEPEIAKSAYQVLSHLGYEVLVPGIWPTGRPQISKGLLADAKKICTQNIQRLYPFAEREIPIIGLEPSEILTLRDEYKDLCDEPNLSKSEKIAGQTFLWEEFLATELAPEEPQNFGNGKTVYIHGHCHTKTLASNNPLIQSLKQLGFNPVELQTGCCGMAGSFGYEKNKYEVSLKIGEQTLFPALRKTGDDELICAPGFSCRHQIADGVQKTAKHPAVIMWDALNGSG